MTRQLKYFEAIREATAECMAADQNVYVIGLGVPGPGAIFDTTSGLTKQFGEDRVLDMPASENAMTNIALGAFTAGMRPIMVHQRMDFATVSMDALVNEVAKWHFMYAGKLKAPLTVRMIIGRGWGQGPQHSQSLQAWFAHVPGLKVVMPTTPYDVKGMLISSVEDDAPVIFLEHRWLYNISGEVPEGPYRVPLDKARVARKGKDITLAATSYMTIESLRAAEMLAEIGIDSEVIDLRCLQPFDTQTLLDSVRKTGHIVVSDTGNTSFGISAEVVCRVAEGAFGHMKAPPHRVALPDTPTPTTPALANLYYPRAEDIATAALKALGSDAVLPVGKNDIKHPLDIPDPSFTGPY